MANEPKNIDNRIPGQNKDIDRFFEEFDRLGDEYRKGIESGGVNGETEMSYQSDSASGTAAERLAERRAAAGKTPRRSSRSGSGNSTSKSTGRTSSDNSAPKKPGRTSSGNSVPEKPGRTSSGNSAPKNSGRTSSGNSVPEKTRRTSSGNSAPEKAKRTSPLAAEKKRSAHPSSTVATQRKPGRPAAAASGSTSGQGQQKNNKGNVMGKKKNGVKKRKKYRALKTTIFILFITAIIMVAGGVLYVFGTIRNIEPPDTKNIESQLFATSTIYDDNGKIIKNIYYGDDGKREIIDYDNLPDDLKNAFIAIEDKTFWKHHGFNFIRIVGAIKDSVFGGGQISGTSTITQQLARNLWIPEDERSERELQRKIKEAYYAVQLENNLNKKEILSGYLNTINLGYQSHGVGAAAKAYFGKEVKDLDLMECATLASLPKMPSILAPILTLSKDSIEKDDPRILLKGKEYYYIYNEDPRLENRIKLVLKNMLDQGYITQPVYDETSRDIAKTLREHLKPKEIAGDSKSSFFVDFAIQNVAEDLMKKYPEIKDMSAALKMVYQGGLEIHSTYNKKTQNILTKEFNEAANYPSVGYMATDGSGNVLNPKNSQLQLYKYSNMFNEKGTFTFKDSEVEVGKDGSLTIMKGNRLNLYQTTVEEQLDVSIEFKDMFQRDEKGRFYIINGGVINIPQDYKSVDKKGNCIISADFFESDFYKSHDGFIKINKGKVSIPKSSYTLNQKVRQPQGAMVLLDHRNGQVVAMVGGREITGEKNFNRTLQPRQPGSSMKPLGAYGPALQMSAEHEEIDSSQEKSFGKFWSPLSIIVDEELKVGGKVWPKNWYSGYRGATTLRKSVEQSMNVNAVKVQLAVGVDRSIDFLHNLGITTLVEEGNTNDLNPAALALGGMTKGLKPIELTSAYGTFANAGVRVAPIAYTEVLDRNGNVVLDGTPEETQAMDPGTAFIMNDILRTTVSEGIAGAAAVSGVPVAGKTGTTSDNFDAWFVGNTPQYSAAVWLGNDVNIQLSEGSTAASRLWSKVMTQVMAGREVGEYPPQPSNVIESKVGGYTDYFIMGTESNSIDIPTKTVNVCVESEYLATPWCPVTEKKDYSEKGTPPEFYCPLHNLKPGKYPVAPGEDVDKGFDPNADEEPEEPKPKPEPPVEPPVEPTPDPVPPQPDPVEPTPPTEPVVPPPDPGTGVAPAALESTAGAASRFNLVHIWIYNSRWLFGSYYNKGTTQ